MPSAGPGPAPDNRPAKRKESSGESAPMLSRKKLPLANLQAQSCKSNQETRRPIPTIMQGVAALPWQRHPARTSIGATRSGLRASERLGFVDQHDGNPVLDRIHQAARVAYQGLRRRAILELSLAFGTYQNLEQLRRQCHASSLDEVPAGAVGVGLGNPNRASAAAVFRQLGSAFTQESRYTGAPINSSSR